MGLLLLAIMNKLMELDIYGDIQNIYSIANNTEKMFLLCLKTI